MEPIKVKVDQSKSRNRYDMKDLIINACHTFDTEYWEDIKNKEIYNHLKETREYDIDDMIHEIADNAVPIYYYDIGQYAAHNSWLMTEIPDINPNGNAHDQIQANIYQAICEGLYEHIAEKESEDEI